MNLLHNGLVAQLPPTDQGLLLRRCEPVELKAGEILSAPGAASGHVYFLLSGTSVALAIAGCGDKAPQERLTPPGPHTLH